MSPGTFYGRPGEVPTFINAAVGAPLTMRGGGEDTGGEGPAGAQEPAQAQQRQVPGQWYHQNQTHGSYFYAMSSPRRKTPTGMEPKGYFDPLFFPVGVNVGNGGGGGGYSSSVGGSGALVNDIMKDGRGESLGVGGRMEEEKGEGRRKVMRRGGEEETHISDDGDDEKDSDDSADGDDDDSGEGEPEVKGENQEAQYTDTRSPTSEEKESDRRPNKGAGTGALFGSTSESSISRTQSLPLNVSHYQQQQQHTWRSLGGVQVFTDLDEAIENTRAVQIPIKAGLGTAPIPHTSS